MTDSAWWSLAAAAVMGGFPLVFWFAVGVGYLGWAWRDARDAERQRKAMHAAFVERAAARHLAWRARTDVCPQCEGLGRVEREA